MNDSIIIAIIGGICTAIPTILTVMSNNKSNQQLTDYKFDELKKQFGDLSNKVEQHNHLSERLLVVENEIKTIKEMIH